jgi:hypothetical protein
LACRIIGGSGIVHEYTSKYVLCVFVRVAANPLRRLTSTCWRLRRGAETGCGLALGAAEFGHRLLELTLEHAEADE